MSTRMKFQFHPGQEPELVPVKNPVIERTERAFEAYVRQHAPTFAAMRECCPKIYDILLDLNKTSFYAGCAYEREWDREEALGRV